MPAPTDGCSVRAPGRHRWEALLLLALALTALAAAPAGAAPARWRVFKKVPGIEDLAGPRSDGRLVLVGRQGTQLWSPGATPRRFAPGSVSDARAEPHIEVAPGRRVPGASCSWQRDDVYLLEPGVRTGLSRIDTRGRRTRIADFELGTAVNGLAFDRVGSFGHRLLVALTRPENTTTFLAFDCSGRFRQLARRVRHVEGGMVVAPRSFGVLGGHLLAPDELSGKVVALSPAGGVRIVGTRPLPGGGDIGVESLGFVPPRPGPGLRAYLADRSLPESDFPGTESVLSVSWGALRRAGAAPGDLLAVTEGQARTIRVRCGQQRCTNRLVATGPDIAHAESIVAFTRGP